MNSKSIPFSPLTFLSILIFWQLGNCEKPLAEGVSQALRNIPSADYSDLGRRLPPGVPRVVNTNGDVVFVDHHFTTAAYQRKALEMVIEEANKVAFELKLDEELPLTESNLVEYHISPFGFAFAYKMIGNVTSKHYVYYVACGNRFNHLDIANYEDECFHLKALGTLSIDKVNSSAAFELATNWLGRASVDIGGLSRECVAHVSVSPFWNGLSRLGDLPKRKFVPIYFVWWTYSENESDGQNGPASVELFMPTKKLLQLDVEDPRFILRRPIEFTNIASLFPGMAAVRTNYPSKSIIVTNSFWGN